MVAPLLQAHVDIDAPVATVWELISDLRRMPQWSPQCRWMKPFGPVRQGTRTLNLNRRKRMFWPTTCTVVEIVPGPPTAPRTGLSMAVHPGRLLLAAPAGRPYEGRPDGLPEAEAEALARHVAPLRA